MDRQIKLLGIPKPMEKKCCNLLVHDCTELSFLAMYKITKSIKYQLISELMRQNGRSAHSTRFQVHIGYSLGAANLT